MPMTNQEATVQSIYRTMSPEQKEKLNRLVGAAVALWGTGLTVDEATVSLFMVDEALNNPRRKPQKVTACQNSKHCIESCCEATSMTH